MMIDLNIPLYLFAKAPVAGQVKTRLSPPLSSSQATQVAVCLLKQASNLLVNDWPGESVLAVSPDSSHPLFQQLITDHQLGVHQQVLSDLGGRMKAALDEGISRAGAAAVIGSDIPGVTPSILDAAYQNLLNGENVIGPTTDGGFYLLGLQETSNDDLFLNVDWGSSQVFAQIMKNARREDIEFSQLPELRDLDDCADLGYFIKEGLLVVEQ